MLILRYEPIAIKMIKDESEIPDGVLHPYRDRGKHLAYCQALAMARRDKVSIYMSPESEWCWNPLVTFGFVDAGVGTEAFEIISVLLGIPDKEQAHKFFAEFPRLPLGKYIGVVVAPLCNCTFEPDLTLIYCNNAQMRSLAWAVKAKTGKIISTQIDAIDSCSYSSVLPQLTGEFRVTIPDVGEYERANADEDEIILTVPQGKLNMLIEGLHAFYDRNMGYPQLKRDMPLDFARPPFYNDLYKMWGLEQGDDWESRQ